MSASDAQPSSLGERRNVHCSNCGSTRGGPMGHEASECNWNGEARLGESRWRSVDKELIRRQEALQALADKVEEYMNVERQTRNLLQVRERELLELKGPCPRAHCRLHADHLLPCIGN